MESILIVHVLAGGDDPFCQMLDEAGISYSRDPKPCGIVMDAGDTIRIAADLAPHAVWATALASVLKAWIKSRNSRKVNFTTKDNEVIHAFEGMTPDEIERLLRTSKSIMVIDTNCKQTAEASNARAQHNKH
jgi:hypothetical protein